MMFMFGVSKLLSVVIKVVLVVLLGKLLIRVMVLLLWLIDSKDKDNVEVFWVLVGVSVGNILVGLVMDWGCLNVL